MRARPNPSAERVRARLSHPVIDSDGHCIEYLPAVRDEVRAVAGEGVEKRFIELTDRLRIWQHHETWLVGVLRQRLGTDDDLRVRSLAAAVMAIFEVVQEAWRPTISGLAPEEAVAGFNRELVRVLGQAGAGWQRPAPPTPVHQT